MPGELSVYELIGLLFKKNNLNNYISLQQSEGCILYLFYIAFTELISNINLITFKHLMDPQTCLLINYNKLSTKLIRSKVVEDIMKNCYRGNKIKAVRLTCEVNRRLDKIISKRKENNVLSDGVKEEFLSEIYQLLKITPFPKINIELFQQVFKKTYYKGKHLKKYQWCSETRALLFCFFEMSLKDILILKTKSVPLIFPNLKRNPSMLSQPETSLLVEPSLEIIHNVKPEDTETKTIHSVIDASSVSKEIYFKETEASTPDREDILQQNNAPSPNNDNSTPKTEASISDIKALSLEIDTSSQNKDSTSSETEESTPFIEDIPQQNSTSSPNNNNPSPDTKASIPDIEIIPVQNDTSSPKKDNPSPEINDLTPAIEAIPQQYSTSSPNNDNFSPDTENKNAAIEVIPIQTDTSSQNNNNPSPAIEVLISDIKPIPLKIDTSSKNKDMSSTDTENLTVAIEAPPQQNSTPSPKNDTPSPETESSISGIKASPLELDTLSPSNDNTSSDTENPTPSIEAIPQKNSISSQNNSKSSSDTKVSIPGIEFIPIQTDTSSLNNDNPSPETESSISSTTAKPLEIDTSSPGNDNSFPDDTQVSPSDIVTKPVILQQFITLKFVPVLKQNESIILTTKSPILKQSSITNRSKSTFKTSSSPKKHSNKNDQKNLSGDGTHTQLINIKIYGMLKDQIYHITFSSIILASLVIAIII
ncbi:hypothetical protein HZS_2685 [Henneguya salminicola]|nr:hypothetical protein HZS_2685 [Henneguya salminicola]